LSVNGLKSRVPETTVTRLSSLNIFMRLILGKTT
jgi:hypothetical protein